MTVTHTGRSLRCDVLEKNLILEKSVLTFGPKFQFNVSGKSSGRQE